ncbi:HtaA domain-containing protein [Herbiconiux sp.]|uniref:HtaA domain-containing protein n=1 Tax=Herbiconiux sp. TaxID=1871186 RepID=UPI0025BFBD57|nr:HtaA domain-containing protein [Herbiconiux sp.]
MPTLPRTALHGLSWPVKQSFARYTAASPGGGIDLGHGASVVPGWDLVFAPATARFDAASGDGEIGFAGSVRYTGHFGALEVTVRDPLLRLTAGTGVLEIGEPDARLILATVSCAYSVGDDGASVWESLTCTLTASGIAFLGGVYEQGTPLDPFSARLAPGGSAVGS